MEYTSNVNQNIRSVNFSGHLTFSDHHKFRQLVDMVREQQGGTINLNFSQVDFIDSAGLGMILLFREECHNRQITVSLIGAKGQVDKIFKLSKFDQLFSMSA